MADVLAAGEAARLTDFARAFKAAARAVVLYPGMHPAITATLSRLTQLTTPPHLTAPLRISVTADTLLIDGSAPARPDAAIAELAALLHAHLVGELTVHGTGDDDAWRRLLVVLGQAPDAVRADGGLAHVWAAMQGRHVEIREIDYRAVLRERAIGIAASWQDVVAKCLAGEAFEIPEDLLESLVDGSAGADTLAEVFAAIDAASVQAGADHASKSAALAGLVRGIVDAVEARAPHRAEAVMRDMATALARVSPELLLGVLEHGDGDTGGRAAIGAVASRMPDGAIAGFVATRAMEAGAPLARVAQAFQALVVDGDRRERLVTLARDTAVAAGARGEAFEQRWQEIAGQLLSEYTDEPFVSKPYARELSGARAQAVEVEHISDDPPERVAAWRATVDTTELRRLDLLMMLDLLRIEDDLGRLETLMRPVAGLLDDLLLVGDFEAADQLVGALRADAWQSAHPWRRVLAQRTLDQLVTAGTMGHLLAQVATLDDARVERVKATCLSLGGALVRPLAEALSVEERSRTRERLTAILLSFGAAGRVEVEQLKNSANAAVRRTAIRLLREYGGSAALPDLTELLDDAEPAVQREAVRAILTIGTDRGYAILERALATGTERSREAIMQALSAPRDERAAPLLIYILAHVDHAGPLAWVYARAVDLLGQLRDPRAVPALRDALCRGEWWAPRRTAALRQAAAAALARIGTDEAAAALTAVADGGPLGARAVARQHLPSLPRTATRGSRS